jgi:transposase
MTCYSNDLRQKIVKAYERGEGSIRGIAQRFLVSPDTVRRLLKQYRLTGDLSPKKCGNPQKAVLSRHEAAALKMVEDHPDWTLWQYCEALTEQLGVNVSTSMMGRFCQQHQLTLKKNLSQPKGSHPTGAARPSRVLAANRQDRPSKAGISR